jgi:hypothetical protein
MNTSMREDLQGLPWAGLCRQTTEQLAALMARAMGMRERGSAAGARDTDAENQKTRQTLQSGGPDERAS